MTAIGGRTAEENLGLPAMIFAVAMTFIDQTTESIAVPQIQDELGLTSTGVHVAAGAHDQRHTAVGFSPLP
jgi:hypothetical protein